MAKEHNRTPDLTSQTHRAINYAINRLQPIL